jgi:hypothetical protein
MVSAHGQSTSLFLDCGEAEHHSEECMVGSQWQGKSAHLMAARKQQQILNPFMYGSIDEIRTLMSQSLSKDPTHEHC